MPITGVTGCLFIADLESVREPGLCSALELGLVINLTQKPGPGTQTRLVRASGGYSLGFPPAIWANVQTEDGRQTWLPRALEECEAALREGKDVIVHCMRGRHRSGAFAAAIKAR